MNVLKQAAIFTFLGIALQSCSTAQLSAQLDEKLARQPVKTRKDLDLRTSRQLAETPGIPDATKGKLWALKEEVRAKLRALDAESLRLRSVLLEDVLTSSESAGEILEIKSRMRRIATQRIDTVFDAVDEANGVLGRRALVEQAMDLQRMEDGQPY